MPNDKMLRRAQLDRLDSALLTKASRLSLFAALRLCVRHHLSPWVSAMDLAIRNGTVVTAGGGFPADVGVREGRIVQVGGEVPRAAREIDARGKLVLPG